MPGSEPSGMFAIMLRKFSSLDGRVGRTSLAPKMLYRNCSRASVQLRHPILRGKTMKNLLMRLWKEEEGQDLTEYALLLVLISLVATAAMGALGDAVSDVFSNAIKNF